MNNINITDPSKELIELFSYKEWRQRIHLYDDIYTPGSRCEYEWDSCHLPKDLKNKTFLDVGANDGMFSFLAERKGASAVTSVDLYIDKQNTDLNMTFGWYIGRILAVKKINNSKIGVQPCSIYELEKLNKKFDVVYCGNVLAWLDNPAEALKQLANVTDQTLILRDDLSRVAGKPVLEYVNTTDLSSCMFNGNKEFYLTYLRSLGFKNISFHMVDEYEILKTRNEDFPKYTITAGVKIYSNPFTDKDTETVKQQTISGACALINNKFFFNYIGWINKDDVNKIMASAIPTNPVKRWLYEKKFRKNAKDNYIIYASK